MRALALTIVFAWGCGGPKVLTTPPAELKAMTYNMYYGLATDLVPEDLSIGSLSSTARAIIDATSLTDFSCRLNGAAHQIVIETPDVIGIQEGLLVAYIRDLDDRDDDKPIIDFLDELVDDIEDQGGPRYQVFQRDNAVIQDVLAFGGIRIADRGAILVHPRFQAKLAGSLTFATLQEASTSVPGTNGVVVRGALHVQAPLVGGTIDFFNTHLQSGAASGDVRQAQSQELSNWIHANSAPGSTIVLTGDLNDVPGSPTYQILTATLTDTYAVAGTPPGFTAYQPQTLTNQTDEATMRIDFILVRAGEVEESRTVLKPQVAPCNLWPSDHFGVVSRFKTAASQ
jgi:endonuclease/exonuclease/phosphatase family metal-dependent hydrolase